jgi:hypothetical protein
VFRRTLTNVLYYGIQRNARFFRHGFGGKPGGMVAADKGQNAFAKFDQIAVRIEESNRLLAPRFFHHVVQQRRARRLDAFDIRRECLRLKAQF